MMKGSLSDNLSNHAAFDVAETLSTAESPETGQPSDSRRQKRESLATERLEAAGRLAAWVAHQINNPLGAISGNAQLLARRLQRDIHDDTTLKAYLKYIDGIQMQAERCAKITGEMLNLTRPGEPDVRPVDVRLAIQDSVDLIQYAYPGTQVAVHEDKSEQLPQVRGDREWLTRVVFELVSNGIAASAGGPIDIKQRPVCAAGEAAGRVCIDVRDFGCGIDESVLPRIFDPFFSTREKARGLGLTLCLEMVGKMGGTLEVVKAEGMCTLFTVAVPIWGRKSL